METKLNVLIKRLDDRATLPSYAHSGDAGMDLFAIDNFFIQPGERRVASTGIAIDIPFGSVGLVHPRSGMAVRHGITVLNAPGTIDAGYRGEVKVCLFNTGTEEYAVYEGDRIAQIVFQAISFGVLHEVTELSDSVRSVNGFGSTGV